MSTQTAPQRLQAYQTLESARRYLLDAIDGLTPEQMTLAVVADWSVKDLLAHVASWDELILPDIRRVKEGQIPAFLTSSPAATDRWNELLIRQRKNFPLEQVLLELHFYRNAALEALDALPEELFTYGYVPAACHLQAMHDREHAAHIREWRQKEGI